MLADWTLLASLCACFYWCIMMCYSAKTRNSKEMLEKRATGNHCNHVFGRPTEP